MIVDGPLLVVGVPRSGTTLLWAMLDLHSEMALVPEWRFAASLLAPHADGTRRSGQEALEEALAHPRVHRDGLETARARERFTAAGGRTPADALRAMFETWAEQQGKPRWGHKNPEDLPRIDLLANAFPDARFVHLIRDGREVADAHRAVEWGTNHLLVAAGRWRDRVAAGRAAGERLGDRYLEVRYEALVEDPADTLRRICAHAGLTFEAHMVDHRRRVTSTAGLPPHHLRVAEPLTPGLRDWRSSWSPGECVAVEALAGPLLDELGYPRSAPRPDAATVRRVTRRHRRQLLAATLSEAGLARLPQLAPLWRRTR